MRFKPAAILLALLLVFGAAWAEDIEEETYDPGDENEYGEGGDEGDDGESDGPVADNPHQTGAFSGGLYLGGMTWPRQDDDGDPYGNDAGGFLVGLRGQYYFIDNLAAFANLDFAFGDYTSMIRLVLGAQYNIPLSNEFTAFIGVERRALLKSPERLRAEIRLAGLSGARSLMIAFYKTFRDHPELIDVVAEELAEPSVETPN